MIEHELAQCHMIHAQGHVFWSQHKSSHKKIPDEREHGKVVGDPVVPKQQYRKKDLRAMLVEGHIGNIIDVPSETNAGLVLGQLDSDKTKGGGDAFADMPPLKDASDHDRSSARQGLSTPISDIVRVLEPGMVGYSHVVMQAKGFDSPLVVDAKNVTTLIDGHHVKVSPTADVRSPSCHTSTQVANTLGMLKHYSR